MTAKTLQMYGQYIKGQRKRGIIQTKMKIDYQKKFWLIFLLVLLLLLSTIAFGVPSTLTLQGKLTNKAGASQSGTFSMSFRIYSVFNYTTYVLNETVQVYNQSSGSYYNSEANITYINYTDIIWEKNKSITTDSNGVYDIILDGINLSFSDQYYLGITVANDNESTPRVNLSAAPYAFRANISEGLNPNQSYSVNNLSVTGNITIGSGVTTLSISTQSFNLTTIGNINIANNITLGDRVTLRFGQFIDNSVKGILKINSSINVTGNLSVNINTLFVDSLSGNVGIGTILPGRALEVSGSINGTQLNISGATRLAYGSGSVAIGIGSYAGSTLTVVGTFNASRSTSAGDLYLDGSGNVGVGTTTPDNKLTIAGTDADTNLGVSGVLHLNITDNYNTSVTNFITLDHSIDNPVNSTGGIGLGIMFRAVTNYSKLANVSFINATLVNTYNGSEASALTFYTRRAGGKLNASLVLNGSDVFIAPNGGNTYLNPSSGNVGIGTASPSSTLQVVGTANITQSATSLRVTSDSNVVIHLE